MRVPLLPTTCGINGGTIDLPLRSTIIKLTTEGFINVVPITVIAQWI
jgi:hypothetical protein